MKKTFILGLFGIFTLIFASGAFGMEKSTPKEVVEKVQQAVKLIQEKGEDAYPMLRDKNGPFIWKDTYIFVGDMEGKLLVHINPKLEGRNMMAAKDATGKLFHAEMINGLKNSPEGYWLEYQWVKPGEKSPSPKVSYHVLVPGTNVFAAAGVWDVTKAEVEQGLK